MDIYLKKWEASFEAEQRQDKVIILEKEIERLANKLLDEAKREDAFSTLRSENIKNMLIKAIQDSKIQAMENSRIDEDTDQKRVILAGNQK